MSTSWRAKPRLRALLTGGNGMLGKSIAQQWQQDRPDDELIIVTRETADLREKYETAALIAEARPDIIVHAAAKVGGIQAKLSAPTGYLLDNVLIDTSVISGAIDAKVPSLLYIGSAAFYPEHYRQPFLEGDILAAPLEAANEGYAIAKIVGAKLCEYASREFGLTYRVAVPSNLYGPNDDYSLSHGHLIAAAIAKIHAAHSSGADTVTIWGDGTARREFTYVGDLAGWLVSQAENLAAWPSLVNLGYGSDHSIADYYEVAREVVGYTGSFVFDTDKPSGMHQRILDSGVARALGWNPSTGIRDGMAEAYSRFVAQSGAGEAQ